MTKYDSWKSTNPADEMIPSAAQPAPQRWTLPDLADRLDAVRHRNLDLEATDAKGLHRPFVSVWPSIDEDMPPAVVTLHLAAEWGVPVRYVDMTPDEARALARHLVEIADLIDRETGRPS
jgi:hypothetical protein